MIVPILLRCVCVLVVTLYLQYRWRHRRVLEAASKLPCPPTLPLIGNAHYLIGDKSKIVKKVFEWANQYNGIFCVWVGPMTQIVCSNPAEAKILLNNSGMLEKPFAYDYMKYYLGEGLITGRVKIWKKHRRMINPCFHSSNIERLLGNLNNIAQDIVTSLDGLGEQSLIDPKSIVFERLLGGIIEITNGRPNRKWSKKAWEQSIIKENVHNSAEIGVGKGMLTLDDEHISKIKNVFKWLLHATILRMFNPAYYCNYIFLLFNWNKHRRAVKNICLLRDIVKQVMEKCKTTGGDNISKQGLWLSLMDVWYEHSSETPADPYWVDEFITFAGAATDTTTSVVCLLMASLATNQEAQEKVYSEIKEVVGSREGDLTLSDLNSLTYLGYAITESMRLHGVVAFIGRVATKDVKMANYTLPAGTEVYFHLHAMGWNPDVFPEPHKFNPDRFMTTDEQESTALINNLMPFGGGPRYCIGKTVGILLVKSIMVAIISKYKLITTIKLEDIEYGLNFVTESKNPIYLQFSKR